MNGWLFIHYNYKKKDCHRRRYYNNTKKKRKSNWTSLKVALSLCWPIAHRYFHGID